MYNPTTKTDFYDTFTNQLKECPKENLTFESSALDNSDLDLDNLNLDLNYFEDQLENFIMLEDLQQTTSTSINNNTHQQLNRQNSTANILNSMEIKTADINNATDYSQIFRGLSTFELVDTYPQNNSDGIKSIKQEDLTDMLIAQQNENDNDIKSFNTLSTVKLVDEEIIHNNLNNLNKENLSLRSVGLIGGSQRNSTDSNASSSVVNVQKKKRGRRPISMLDNASNKLVSHPNRPPTKRERIIEEAHDNGSKVVCFGNKVVEKDTEEYKKRRVSNNEAVKKCRQKLMEEQSMKEERMKSLDDENRRLNGKVESLQKELSVLKNILLQMSPHKKMPEGFEKMIKSIDEA